MRLWSLRRPSPARVQSFLAKQADARLSYSEVGLTNNPPTSAGPHAYVEDRYEVRLGRGKGDFDRAVQGLREWQMFSLGWVQQCRENATLEVGTDVAVLVRALGIFWLNAARIVYVLDELASNELRFGFAYGTLEDHAERGEEQFLICMSATEEVRYQIRAFSQPAQLAARLAYPITRMYQRAFGRDSLRAMQAFVGG